MRKVIDKILIFIWIIDILNIGTSLFRFNLVEFLDITLPINGLAWLLIWIFVQEEIMKKKVFRERRANNTVITAEKAIELIDKGAKKLKGEVKKTKRTSKKKEA